MTKGGAAMGGAEWLLLVLLSVLWGGSFFFYKVLVHALPPLTVVLGRMAIAAAALNLWLVLRRDPMPTSPRLWAELIGLGVINNALPFTCFAWSELRISSGLAAILNATTPVFAVLVAALFKAAPLTPTRAVAVLFGFIGVIVLIGPSALGGSLGELGSEAACLVAALSYAFGGFYGRRFSALGPLKVAAGQTAGAALAILPVAAVADRFWRLPMPGPPVWGALLGIALISTALAYVIYFHILRRAGAMNLMLVTFLVPISALILGRLLLNEPIRPAAYWGMAMIGLSLAAIDGRLPARLATWILRPEPARTRLD